MDETIRANQKRRLRCPLGVTIVILSLLETKSWVQDDICFHHQFHRRFASFEQDLRHGLRAPIKSCCQQRRRRSISAALLEIQDSRNSNAASFDYTKIPPISDTTPCEVINTFDRNGIGPDEDPQRVDETFYFPSREELATLPQGDRGGYHIVRQYIVVGENSNSVAPIQTKDMTLQSVLTELDPENYPTLTRARKACRRGMILVKRKNQQIYTEQQKLFVNCSNNVDTGGSNDNSDGFCRGNVGDRLSPGDVIGVQMFLGTYRKKQCYPNIEYSRPQFQLPVLYEDDHIAVVNKPAGVAVYSETRGSNSGSAKTGNRRTVHFALPFVLTPPKRDTEGGILRRPGIVHRIDKPTSGLLIVAKTKVAMDSLYTQFRNRDVQKIYTAIVNGDLMPEEQAQELPGKENSNHWNLIDYPLGGKYALSSWKILQRIRSLNARDGILTMVEVRLHTGRYHQIRRHFAWWCRKPLVGDHLYAGLLQAHHFRKKGLFLCSNGISFLHPVQSHQRCDDDANDRTSTIAEVRRVEVTIDPPKRFHKLMNAEESWADNKLKKEEDQKLRD